MHTDTDTDAPCIWLFWLRSGSPDWRTLTHKYEYNHTTAECSPCLFAKNKKKQNWRAAACSYGCESSHVWVPLPVCVPWRHRIHAHHTTSALVCVSVCLHLQWWAWVLAQLALRLLFAFPPAIKIRIRCEFIGGETNCKWIFDRSTYVSPV